MHERDETESGESRTHPAAISPEDILRIRSYLDGRDAAFAEVDSWILAEARRCYPALRSEHEDLSQSVHGRLLDSLRAGRFEGRSALRTYVNGILHRAAIARLRQQYRERLFTESHPEAFGRPQDNPYSRIEAMDEKRQIEQVLLSLPQACRSLWKLVFADKLTYDQTAERLSIPPGTVKSRMWYCRKKAVAVLERLGRARRRPRGAGGAE